MSSRSFMFYGIRVVRPKGLRKSPKPNARARCMRQAILDLGPHPGRAKIQQTFGSACKGARGS